MENAEVGSISGRIPNALKEVMTYYWKISKKILGFRLYMDTDGPPNSKGYVQMPNGRFNCDMTRYMFGKLIKNRIRIAQAILVAKYHKKQNKEEKHKELISALEQNTTGDSASYPC